MLAQTRGRARSFRDGAARRADNQCGLGAACDLDRLLRVGLVVVAIGCAQRGRFVARSIAPACSRAGSLAPLCASACSPASSPAGRILCACCAACLPQLAFSLARFPAPVCSLACWLACPSLACWLARVPLPACVLTRALAPARSLARLCIARLSLGACLHDCLLACLSSCLLSGSYACFSSPARFLAVSLTGSLAGAHPWSLACRRARLLARLLAAAGSLACWPVCLPQLADLLDGLLALACSLAWLLDLLGVLICWMACLLAPRVLVGGRACPSWHARRLIC